MCGNLFFVAMRSLVPPTVPLCNAEKANGFLLLSMVPTVKHGGGGMMVAGCFASDTVGDLFKIEGALN